MIKYTIVHFNPTGDFVTAIYKDGFLKEYGDYYHNKIEERFEGYFEALKDFSIEHTVDKFICINEDLNEDVYELAAEPPLTLDELQGSLELYQ